MKILFMGTPEFAAKGLAALLTTGDEIVVFSQPDKPVGRKQVLTTPPVKQLALEHGLTLYQPEKLKDGRAMELVREIQPDLIVVVAYGRILPQEMLEFPPLGCINVHGSLLPKYRGAAPIQWSLVRGESETGVTVQHMALELDAGDMILSKSLPIGPKETAGELHDRLMELGAEALLEAVALLKTNAAPRIPQNPEEATFAPILKKEDGLLDFNQSARAVYNHMRGFDPWPGVFWENLRIWNAELTGQRSDAPVGTVVNGNGVVCGDGEILRLLEVQPAGGRRMDIDAYLRGHSLP